MNPYFSLIYSHVLLEMAKGASSTLSEIALLSIIFVRASADRDGFDYGAYDEDQFGDSIGIQVKAKVLDDSTFEHDTQASTGMTTGDWLVGRSTDGVDLPVATKLHGKGIVAFVNTEKNPGLANASQSVTESHAPFRSKMYTQSRTLKSGMVFLSFFSSWRRSRCCDPPAPIVFSLSRDGRYLP